jgi:hypothetical protein
VTKDDLLAEWECAKPERPKGFYGCSTGGGLQAFAEWATGVHGTTAVLTAMGWSTVDLERLTSTGRDVDLPARPRPGGARKQGKATEQQRVWNQAWWAGVAGSSDVR